MNPQIRDGWMVGLGYGIGVAKVQGGDALNRLETGWEEGACPQIRVGHKLGRRLLIGYDQRQWVDEQGIGTDAVRASLQNFAAALTFYPGNPENETGGIYLRAGAGIANARIAATELDTTSTGSGGSGTGTSTTHEEEHRDEGGLGLLFGGGYEFRLTKSFGAGLDVTASYQSIGNEFFDKTWFVPLTLNLSWYF